MKKTDWIKRNVVEEPRLSELVDLYKELGFEVKLESYQPGCDMPEDCNSCMMENLEKYKVIYTRKITE